MTLLWTASFATILILFNAYSAILTTTNSTASITNYYQDFASCSCDLTPSLCDNYCCCDSQCGSSSSAWVAANQCFTTSSSIEVPCGQSSKGFGSISDLACIYYSNRGTIGYYYQSQQAASLTTVSASLFSSISTATPQSAQTSLLSSLSLGSSYTATNRYLKTSNNSYLYVPMPGVGGFCTPGLVNLTTSGTFTCKVIPTAQNCASLNAPYAGTNSICLNSACSSSSSTFSYSSSTPSGSTCQNIATGFTFSTILGYSNGSYTLQTATPFTSSNPSATLNTQYTVTVTISLTTANTAKSGNPGYIQGKAITMSGGISGIINSVTGNCATASTNPAISIPFGVSSTYSCSSPSPCSSSYYIDTLSNLNLTINKYAAQSTDTISVGGNATMGCKAERYTLNILYSLNGWELDPQYYILAASISASATPDSSNPTSKYLTITWTYVDPTTVSTPPSNSFYTYFSYLWTPLKQKFGMS